MRGGWRFALVWLIAIVVTTGSGRLEAAGFECRQSQLAQNPAPLKVLSSRLAASQPVDILTIGSSSTEGVGASSRDKSYPSRLEALLRTLWPNASVTVENAGIGGETARETLQRLKAALAERRHELVIWQVGTNDAVRGGDLAAFRGLLSEGIAAAAQAGVALVVLDPQYYPSVGNPERYRSFVEAIGTTAREQAVPVLSRYAAMAGWYQRDAEAFNAAMAADRFHMGDLGYDCLARDIAATLAAMTGTDAPRATQTAAVGSTRR